MRLLALHGETYVVIVAFLYEGKSNENLKAIYVNDDGEIDADDVANFIVTVTTPEGGDVVEALQNMKVKSW